MSNIKVSVMITYYNQKEYLETSLKSVLNQETSFDYEILCGDDGSNDGTYELLLEWKNKYPDIIYVYQMDRKPGKYEPIVRVSNNRYNLLTHAKGKYIAFLDGDDYYIDSHKLQKQVDILEKYQDYSCCGHPMQMVWDDKSNKDRYIGKINDEMLFIKSNLYWSSYWMHSDSFLYRNTFDTFKNVINKDLFDDNLITAYFINNGNVIYIPDVMCAYRQIGNSSWNDRDSIGKAYVNMFAYQEAKRVLPNMKFENYCRNCECIKEVYNSRKTGRLSFSNDNLFKLTDRFFVDSVNYSKSSFLQKFIYNCKYFFFVHAMFFARKIAWSNMLKYRRAD